MHMLVLRVWSERYYVFIAVSEIKPKRHSPVPSLPRAPGLVKGYQLVGGGEF